MPELPEVETTRRGIEPHLRGRTVDRVLVRERRLRWLLPPGFEDAPVGDTVIGVARRAKYLLVAFHGGTLLVHLGMSGSLRILANAHPPGRHDHVDFCLNDGSLLRFHDPRRFGSLHWLTGLASAHPLLKGLGPEPLSPEFDGSFLHRQARRRRVAVKPFIMNQAVVVGVGNIYAAEALYRAGISPLRQAGRISPARYSVLADCIKAVLGEAIEEGGTTLRDFVAEDGRPGYFRQQLAVYGREEQPCLTCGAKLRHVRLGQRSTVYCVKCQR